MTKSEKWLPIPRYEGFYEVSDWGRVRSLERKITYKDGRVYTVKSKHLKTTPNVNGYPTVALCRNNVGIKHEVHRLVLTAFIGEREEGKQGCHNDGNPLNNNLSNLRWDTVSENRKDCVRHGRNQFSNRTHCPRGHALEIPNLRPADLKNGCRSCLACARASQLIRNRGLSRRLLKELGDKYFESIIKNEKGS